MCSLRSKALPGPWQYEAVSCLCGLRNEMCHSLSVKGDGAAAIVSLWRVSAPAVLDNP